MAAPVTNVDTLLNASGCYSGQTLGLADQKSLQIYLLAVQLAAVGGTNYIGQFDDNLMTDSVCWQNKQPAEMAQLQLEIDYNNAVAAGGVVSTDVSTQLLQVCRLRHADVMQLDGMILYLEASLGYAKTFPQ